MTERQTIPELPSRVIDSCRLTPISCLESNRLGSWEVNLFNKCWSEEIHSTSKIMSNHTDFYATPLLISTWNLCLCHGRFPSFMEEKMLQVFPLLINSTSQVWDRHSIFTFTFFFPTQGSIKLVFPFALYWESFIHWTTTLVRMQRVTFFKRMWEALRNVDRHGTGSV